MASAITGEAEHSLWTLHVPGCCTGEPQIVALDEAALLHRIPVQDLKTGPEDEGFFGY